MYIVEVPVCIGTGWYSYYILGGTMKISLSCVNNEKFIMLDIVAAFPAYIIPI